MTSAHAAQHRQIEGMLLGLAVGDALGVPYEFRSRGEMDAAPAVGLIGHGSHNQLPGTWSDDTSLTACLMESIIHTRLDEPPFVDIQDLGDRFINWFNDGYWTARGDVFDIGITTRAALLALESELEPADPTEFNDMTQGNGSLMRVLPLAFYPGEVEDAALWNCIHAVSGVTHGHPGCVLSCYLYVQYARQLLLHNNPKAAYEAMQAAGQEVIAKGIAKLDAAPFQRLLDGQVPTMLRTEVRSSGYVVDTLEAALWCLHNTGTYRDCVLAAVNLGNDTDTSGAVAGGLAGLLYGTEAIPADWRGGLAQHEALRDLAARFGAAVA